MMICLFIGAIIVCVINVMARDKAIARSVFITLLFAGVFWFTKKHLLVLFPVWVQTLRGWLS